ncbi:alpha/beta hydrolase [Aspergillus tanneri]|uniref:Dienelactone hydrolase domain-containing protein n=1 Tax=Aspergillus tanneri TaxID=1220188 RepID=A0A5M9MZ33_9EURO|nr:uncharacterized protein ATNIH1004_003291 [Aspergillus tanneri]KAA8650604.1 hypothetical protein ATNIH1004_003291 [Aspergillus tanneri]
MSSDDTPTRDVGPLAVLCVVCLSHNRAGAAVIICHPWTSIKEQSPANYVQVLTDAGFTCLTYDSAYQGESEGLPRGLEDCAQRVEDIKSTVTYLTGRKDVDSNKIGVLDICALAGYASFATRPTCASKSLCNICRRLRGHHEVTAKDRDSDGTAEKVPIVFMFPDKPDAAGSKLVEYFEKEL